jgi:hypothetical protein
MRPPTAIERRDVIVVVAHPDDEVLWLSAALPFATAILAAFVETPGDPQLTAKRALVLNDYPLDSFAYLGLRHAVEYAQSDFLSRAPVEHGVTLMRSCPPEQAALYRSNYFALIKAVEPYVTEGVDIYTHNPWGEYGHEEHIQVNHAMVAVAKRHKCSVWVWDGLSTEELESKRVLLRSDWYPDVRLRDVPAMDLGVDVRQFEQLRTLYQRHGAWTYGDDYKPPNPSRFIQMVRSGEVLLSARQPSRRRRASLLGQVVGAKARYYTRRVADKSVAIGRRPAR